MARKTYSVLLVDDSEDDRWFICRALDRNDRFAVIGQLGDGEAAIAYLSGRNPFHDRKQHPLPDLMLLDLKMPRVTGHEVLRWLKTQSFAQLHVAVISGSTLHEDIAESLALGAIGHYEKHALREDQEAMFKALEQLLDQRQAA